MLSLDPLSSLCRRRISTIAAKTIEMLATLEDEEDAVLADRIAASSRYSYHKSTAFEMDVSRMTVASESLLCALSGALNNPPPLFQQLTARDFCMWIVSLKTVEDEYFSFSTYANHPSALACLFRDNGETMSSQVSQDIANRFSGKQSVWLAKLAPASPKARSERIHFSSCFFKQLDSSMLVGTTRDLIFARTFMLLTWNLMSRVADTTSVCYQPVQWGEDALRVYFAHMMNDQGGSRPRDPRHDNANPLHPEIFPILGIGIYWATQGIDSKNCCVFPGSNQYDHFRKILGRVLGQSAKAEKLAATFCSSGSTACPSAIAVHLRGGWLWAV